MIDQDEAVKILGDAQVGVITIDDKFKEACRLGKLALLKPREIVKKVIWQDVVLMIGGFIFAPSLIVSIVNNVKIPIATSLPTALVLTAFVWCFTTLKFRLAALATSLTAICWYILLIMAL